MNSLGSDLAFSVSFSIANELRDAASEWRLTEEELIGIVLLLAVMLGGLPSAVKSVVGLLQRRLQPRNAADKPASTHKPDEHKQSEVLQFVSLLIQMAERISISLCVQLLAANVRSRQPLRSVRVVSLLSVVIFFLFFERTNSIGRDKQQS